ncbi:secretin N-terminal domain-containing protein [Kamptonema cortianum]|nr:secretin N-terminal domain-containing protein [Geitlerinema splendidum]MDK3156020.1 secretin N-terminal domain-containing protein [Kamptonema cortianum]
MQTRIISLALAAVALAGPMVASAQFETGANAQRQPAWEQFKLDPNKKIQLNFRNANVDLVLDMFMKASGITIVKDPTLNQPMTVSSPKAVSLKEAFEILNAALSVRNFELQKQGNLLVITQRRNRENSGFDMEALTRMMQGNTGDVTLEVYRIKYAAASEVARVINEVFQQQQQSQNPFAFMGGGNQRGGRGGFSGFDPRSLFSGQSQGTQIRASSDDFSNSVIVNAPRTKQREVEALIEEIDKQTEQPMQTKVYKLEFADASQLAPTIQTVLTANAPTGRGSTGQGRPQQGFGGFLSRVLGPGANQANVTAETRSNSLVVAATTDQQLVVESLIKELDTEVIVENTTFVIPLTNARADSVATLLQSAFGNRNTGGNRTGGTNNNRNFGGGNNNNRNTGRTNNNRGGGGFGGGRSVDPVTSADGQSIEIPLEDDLGYNEAELLTQIRVGQGGFGAQQGSQGALGRTGDGRLVNINDLGGQVTVIPDPATNSLIIVTDPANLAILQGILAQLDKIPEQVMIETIIVEATLDSSMKLGVEWNYAQNPAFGQVGASGNATTGFGLQNANPALQGFRYTLTGGNLGGFVNALATDDRFQVLSTPRIFTSNNVEAEINISQSVPFILSTREDANGNLTFNYSFQDVGIVLNVLPRITSNGTVTMDVTQTANDLQGFTDFNAPIVNQRQASTTVSVRDGETIVLGGIMRSQITSKVKKLPLLGDIPILGELFKSREKQNVKTELLVFLTPKIVGSDEDGKRLREQQQSQLSPESQKALEKVIPKVDPDKGSGFKKGPKNTSGNGK